MAGKYYFRGMGLDVHLKRRIGSKRSSFDKQLARREKRRYDGP